VNTTPMLLKARAAEAAALARCLRSAHQRAENRRAEHGIEKFFSIAKTNFHCCTRPGTLDFECELSRNEEREVRTLVTTCGSPYDRNVIASSTKPWIVQYRTKLSPRRVSRTPLRLSVVFCWRDADGVHESEGTTRDISPQGLFVETPDASLVHGVVRCFMLLPSLLDTRLEESDLEATVVGRVIRTERSGVSGFAVQSRVFVLRRV
jgi:hypothetical protein